MDLTKTNCRIFVAASGAGARIQSALWDTPGASAYLEGCVFPYSPEASTRFLGFRPPHFVSREEAIDLAIAAYRQVANCGPDKNPIGLGLTASVSSLRPHRGEHRIFATAISRTRVLSSEMVLPKEPVDRALDGRVADAIGIELIAAISGLRQATEVAETQSTTEGSALRDDLEFARQHFLQRPLLFRDGTRGLKPEGEVKLCPGAFNPLHQGHLASAPDDVIFHVTANPPHKPALSLQEMLERSLQFLGQRDVMFTEGDALYLDKARRFPGSTFYIGTDVMERILDPKWGLEPEPMLHEFQELGTHFMVSPRGELRLRDLLPLLPKPTYRLLFTELPKTEYADLSSTQVRAKTDLSAV